MGWRVFLQEGCEDAVDCRLANVNQHVRVGEPLHGADLIPLQGMRQPIDRLSTIILLKHFLVSHRRDAVVVELEPSRLPIRFDECKVVPTVQIT